MSKLLYIYKSGETDTSIGKSYQWGETNDVAYANGQPVLYSNLLDGNSPVRAIVKQYEYVDQFMGERYVLMNIVSPLPISFQRGDWCIVNNEKMTLRYIPTGKKQARKDKYGEAFVYENVKLGSITGSLVLRDFLDYDNSTKEDTYTGLGEFSFYVETLWDFARKIQANLNVAFPDDGWIVEVVEDPDYAYSKQWRKQTVSISKNTSILSAIAMLNSVFNQNYTIKMRSAGYQYTKEDGTKATLAKDSPVITVGNYMEVMPNVLSYGMGRGLRNLTVTTDSNSSAVTRLHAFGSTRNMPYRYYNRKYKTRLVDGTPLYPKYWTEGEDCGTYILESKHFPNLMLPEKFWKINKNKSNERLNLLNVSIDSTTENYANNDIKEYVVEEVTDSVTGKKRTQGSYKAKKGILNYNSSGVLLNPDDVIEDQKTFDSEDNEFDEVYPTLEKMTIDKSWKGLTAYNTNYFTLEDNGTKRTVRSIIEEVIDKNPSFFGYVEDVQISADTCDYEHIPSNLAFSDDIYYFLKVIPKTIYIDCAKKVSNDEKVILDVEGRKKAASALQEFFGKNTNIISYLEGLEEKNKISVVDFICKNLKIENNIIYVRDDVDMDVVSNNSHIDMNYVYDKMFKNDNSIYKQIIYWGLTNSNISYYYYTEYYVRVEFEYKGEQVYFEIRNIFDKKDCGTAFEKYHFDFSCKVNYDLSKIAAKANILLHKGFANAPADPEEAKELKNYYFTENVSDTHYLSETEINGIVANTYQSSGRLDKVISPSYEYETKDTIRHTGILEDSADGTNNMSTDGINVITDTWQIYIPQICFDIETFKNDDVKLCMKTGDCAGREFSIASCVPADVNDYTKGWLLTMSNSSGFDSSLNMFFPNCNYLIKPGDEYVITGINMPDVYVEAAEKKLEKYAMQYMKDVDTVSRTYEVELDNKWLYENADYANGLYSGKKFIFSDFDKDESNVGKGDLGLGITAVTIKQVGIKFGYSEIPQYTISLASDAQAITLESAVGEQIKGVRADFSELLKKDIKTSVASFLDKYSEKDNVVSGRTTFSKGIETEEITIGSTVKTGDKKGVSGTFSMNINVNGEDYPIGEITILNGIVVNIKDKNGIEVAH